MSSAAIISRIAELNDRFRANAGSPLARSAGTPPGTILVTRGIADLTTDELVGVMQKVRSFDRFTEHTDPYGEHDFGSFEVDGVGKVFWKIEYYADHQCCSGSANPEDPETSFRVLTVMLAEEY